jgi:hypothetical protein
MQDACASQPPGQLPVLTQVVPLNVKPALQLHVYVPGWLTQQFVQAAAPPQGPGCGLHSLLSAHVVPLKV